MRLPGESGKLVESVPEVARSLNIALVCGCAAGLLNVGGIALLTWAVTPLLVSLSLHQSMQWALVFSVAALLLAFFLRLKAEERAHEASYQLEETLRARLVEHLSRLPLGVVQGWGSGRLRKIIQDDVKALHVAVADAVPFIGASLSQPVAALILLSIVQWRMALVTVLTLPVSMVCMAAMAKDNPQRRARYHEASEAVNAGVIELVQGMAVMRTFDNGAAGWQRFCTRLQYFTTAVEAWMASSNMPWKINRIVGAALPVAVVLLVSGYAFFSTQQITLAQWLLALMVGTLPIKAFEPLVHLANYLNDADAASLRIGEVLAQPVLPEPALPQVPQGNRLHLNNVSFNYPGQYSTGTRGDSF
ncbi:ABC transporter transmembrane domain-containing protein [Klebsiella variicola]